MPSPVGGIPSYQKCQRASTWKRRACWKLRCWAYHTPVEWISLEAPPMVRAFANMLILAVAQSAETWSGVGRGGALLHHSASGIRRCQTLAGPCAGGFAGGGASGIEDGQPLSPGVRAQRLIRQEQNDAYQESLRVRHFPRQLSFCQVKFRQLNVFGN